MDSVERLSINYNEAGVVVARDDADMRRQMCYRQRPGKLKERSITSRVIIESTHVRSAANTKVRMRIGTQAIKV